MTHHDQSIEPAARNPTQVDVARTLREFAAEFDPRFDAYLTAGIDVPQRLWQAVRYSALAPGKRIRPYLVVRSCELAGGNRELAWPAAAAVECIHAFSLIHDDLPAMDDDDLRRGRPTCHKQFDEATAILAGDALAVLAFELLAKNAFPPLVGGAEMSNGECRMLNVASPLVGGAGSEGARERILAPASVASPLVGGAGSEAARERILAPASVASPLVGGAGPAITVRMIAELAAATGWSGMIGGQAADMECASPPAGGPTHVASPLVGGAPAAPSPLVGGAPAGPSPPVGGAPIDVVRSIHHRKTARLFEAACRLGALAADAPPDCLHAVASFGQMLGRAFQIADDLLDVTAGTASLGKRSGKDRDAGKQTYPRSVGLEESRAAATEAVQAAIARLDRFDARADDLRALAAYVVNRSY